MFQHLDVNEMLELAIHHLQSCNCNALPVMQQGQLVGLLTPENIREFLQIQSALGKTHEHLLPRGA
jgi:hypothetical protein